MTLAKQTGIGKWVNQHIRTCVTKAGIKNKDKTVRSQYRGVLVCQKLVSRVETSNYLPQYLCSSSRYQGQVLDCQLTTSHSTCVQEAGIKHLTVSVGCNLPYCVSLYSTLLDKREKQTFYITSDWAQLYTCHYKACLFVKKKGLHRLLRICWLSIFHFLINGSLEPEFYIMYISPICHQRLK